MTSIAWTRSRRVPLATAVLAAIFVAIFVVELFTTGVEPSSLLGELLGIAAALALVAIMAYSARRSLPAVRKLGPMRRYLDVHLWGGVLFFVLVLLHTGFSLPRSGLPIALWAFSMWVVATGLVGWLLQRSLPKILEPSASFEAHLQRIPEFVGELRKRADAVAHGADPHVKTFYQQRVAADMKAARFLSPATFSKGRSLGGSGDQGEVDILRRILAPEGHAALTQIMELRATKHEIDVHFTIQRILRGWLLLHLPVAVALLVLVALHIGLVVYY